MSVEQILGLAKGLLDMVGMGNFFKALGVVALAGSVIKYFRNN